MTKCQMTFCGSNVSEKRWKCRIPNCKNFKLSNKNLPNTIYVHRLWKRHRVCTFLQFSFSVICRLDNMSFGNLAFGNLVFNFES
jgi:hypothetical protein